MDKRVIWVIPLNWWNYHMNLIQLAEPLFVEYLDCFQFGAIMNHATVTLPMQSLCVDTCFLCEILKAK